MRRLVATIAFSLVLTFATCGIAFGSSAEASVGDATAISIEDISSTDELTDDASQEVADTVASLDAEWAELSAGITNYDEYMAKEADVEAFCDKTVTTNEQLCIRMREYSVRFAELVLASDDDNDGKYKALDDIIDEIYNGACDDILDGIYDGTLDDMLDYLYDGVLDDQPDGVEYADFYGAKSDVYEMVSDSQSDVYKDISDASSDIYGFESDVSSCVYQDDLEKAQKKIDNFKDDIDKLNGVADVSTAGSASEDTSAVVIEDISSTDELTDDASREVADTVASLDAEWAELSAGITNYDEYMAKEADVESFYDKVVAVNEQLCIRMREYSVRFAELVLASDDDNNGKYEALNDITDEIYDGACDDILDGIYDGTLDDMLDYLYDGVLDDQPDGVEYTDFYDARSNEYDMWSDSRSAVYGDYSDARLDIFEFGSDMRGSVLGDDLEKAQKKIDDFKDDIAKLKGESGISDASGSSAASGAVGSSETSAETAGSASASESAASGSASSSASTLKTDYKTPEEILDAIEKLSDDSIAKIRTSYESINDTIDGSYDNYKANPQLITDWYTLINSESTQLYGNVDTLCEAYYRMVLDTYKGDFSKANDAVADLYDKVYSDVLSDYYDKVYGDMLSDEYEEYYTDVLSDATDVSDYTEWSNDLVTFSTDWTNEYSSFYTSWLSEYTKFYTTWSAIYAGIVSGNYDYDSLMGEANKALEESSTDTSSQSGESSSLLSSLPTSILTSLPTSLLGAK